MKSNIFQSIKPNRPKRTKFNLSHEVKLSCKMGQLIPVMLEEVVPGDQYRIKTESLIRLAPMIAPVMHRVNVYFHYFFVPNRILWTDWEKFITGEIASMPPQINNAAVCPKGSLGDYMGFPIGKTTQQAGGVSALPIRAYYKIFNDYYRDQNLQTEYNINTIDYNEMNSVPLVRAWEKDYFTSALPWAQKGEEVFIPGTGVFNPEYTDSSRIQRGVPQGGAPPNGALENQNGDLFVTPSGDLSRIENLVTDQTVETEININDLRLAYRIQKWFERQARAGSRYTETILSHFGILSEDARLQRPEYLGGGKSPIVISEVLSTYGSESAPQGNMSGHGLGVGVTNIANKFVKEHGYIMCIMSVIPRTAYQEGVHKHWTRKDKFEFYWPEFANLGEQEVLNKEIYLSTSTATNETVFGYQSRYAEMKYKPSTVHGDFRDNLSFYHMGRIFGANQALNEDFITCKTNEINERVFAAGDLADQLWVQIYHDVQATRPMPYYGTPSL